MLSQRPVMGRTMPVGSTDTTATGFELSFERILPNLFVPSNVIESDIVIFQFNNLFYLVHYEKNVGDISSERSRLVAFEQYTGTNH